MKTISTPEPERNAEDLRPEHRLDYRKAHPNRFAGQIDRGQVLVVLDPSISRVFTTPESVYRTPDGDDES
jgi:hypothetical protein